MNKQAKMIIGGLVLGSFVLIRLLFATFPGFFELWELQATDFLFRTKDTFSEKKINPTIIHVDVDDQSLGLMPYSASDKRLYARLINILGQAGVSAVFIDILFPKCIDGSECFEFVEALAKFNNVYMPTILKPSKNNSSTEAENLAGFPDSLFWQPDLIFPATAKKYEIAFGNFAKIDQNAKGIGHITVYPDRDGVFRRLPLMMRHEKGFIPLASFRMLCDFLSVSPGQIQGKFGADIILKGAHFPDGRTKDVAIPVDFQGRAIINFAGTWADSFPHYSASRLLDIEKDVNSFELLRDEIEESLVIISDVSTGSRDSGPIPLESFYPLSGLHANLMNSILAQSFIGNISFVPELLLDLLFMIVLAFTALKFRGGKYGMIGMATLIIYNLASVTLFISKQLLLTTVRPSLSIVLAITSVSLYKFVLDERERAFIQARFKNYFAPELLAKILKSPETITRCEKKSLTVLFSDIVGFTQWSSLKRPEDVHHTLNEYFDEMAGIVFKYGGTIDKYMGDGLLAFFGDPIEYPDHAQRAVSAALAMQEKAKFLRRKWSKNNIMDLRIRVGINTGEVIVGNLGSEKKLDYTVIGANVNLAQRLESNAPSGGILISQAVKQELNSSFITKEVEAIHAKGFADKIVVFEVTG